MSWPPRKACPSRPSSRRRSHHRSEEHTSELQSPCNLVCRLLLEKKKKNNITNHLLTFNTPYATLLPVSPITISMTNALTRRLHFYVSDLCRRLQHILVCSLHHST